MTKVNKLMQFYPYSIWKMDKCLAYLTRDCLGLQFPLWLFRILILIMMKLT